MRQYMRQSYAYSRLLIKCRGSTMYICTAYSIHHLAYKCKKKHKYFCLLVHQDKY
jgi:hypothetical protein